MQCGFYIPSEHQLRSVTDDGVAKLDHTFYWIKAHYLVEEALDDRILLTGDTRKPRPRKALVDLSHWNWQTGLDLVDFAENGIEEDLGGCHASDPFRINSAVQ